MNINNNETNSKDIVPPDWNKPIDTKSRTSRGEINNNPEPINGEYTQVTSKSYTPEEIKHRIIIKILCHLYNIDIDIDKLIFENQSYRKSLEKQIHLRNKHYDDFIVASRNNKEILKIIFTKKNLFAENTEIKKISCDSKDHEIKWITDEKDLVKIIEEAKKNHDRIIEEAKKNHDRIIEEAKKNHDRKLRRNKIYILFYSSLLIGLFLYILPGLIVQHEINHNYYVQFEAEPLGITVELEKSCTLLKMIEIIDLDRHKNDIQSICDKAIKARNLCLKEEPNKFIACIKYTSAPN